MRKTGWTRGKPKKAIPSQAKKGLGFLEGVETSEWVPTIISHKRPAPSGHLREDDDIVQIASEEAGVVSSILTRGTT